MYNKSDGIVGGNGGRTGLKNGLDIIFLGYSQVKNVLLNFIDFNFVKPEKYGDRTLLTGKNISVEILEMNFKHSPENPAISAIGYSGVKIDDEEGVMEKNPITSSELEHGEQKSKNVVYAAHSAKTIFISFVVHKKRRQLTDEDIDDIIANLTFKGAAKNKSLKNKSAIFNITADTFSYDKDKKVFNGYIKADGCFFLSYLAKKIYFCDALLELTCDFANSPCKVYFGSRGSNKQTFMENFRFYLIPYAPKNNVFNVEIKDKWVPIVLIDFLAEEFTPNTYDNELYSKDCERYNIDLSDGDDYQNNLKYALGYITEKVHMSDKLIYMSNMSPLKNLLSLDDFPLLYFLSKGITFYLECTSYAPLLIYCFAIIDVKSDEIFINCQFLDEELSKVGNDIWDLKCYIEETEQDSKRKTQNVLHGLSTRLKALISWLGGLNIDNSKLSKLEGIVSDTITNGVDQTFKLDSLLSNINHEITKIFNCFKTINVNLYATACTKQCGEYENHAFVIAKLVGNGSTLCYDACVSYKKDGKHKIMSNLCFFREKQASEKQMINLSDDSSFYKVADFSSSDNGLELFVNDIKEPPESYIDYFFNNRGEIKIYNISFLKMEEKEYRTEKLEELEELLMTYKV